MLPDLPETKYSMSQQPESYGPKTMSNQCHHFKDTAIHQSKSPEALTELSDEWVQMRLGCQALPSQNPVHFPVWTFAQDGEGRKTSCVGPGLALTVA